MLEFCQLLTCEEKRVDDMIEQGKKISCSIYTLYGDEENHVALIGFLSSIECHFYA